MISLRSHARLDRVFAGVLVVSPWLFAFSRIHPARNLFVALGIALFAYSSIRVLSLGIHDLCDVFVGFFLMSGPFFYQYRDSLSGVQILLHFAIGFGLWVVRALADGRMIGYVGLSVPMFLPEILPAVEVGWRFAPAEWGQGYATEGASAALAEAFTTLGLEWVCSLPQSVNPRSARVAERLGMKLSREVIVPANERRGELPCLLYEIDRRSWLRQSSGLSHHPESAGGGWSDQ